MNAPTLHTQRLTLRHHQLSDLEPLIALFASDRAVYMDGPISAKHAWRWIASEVGSWSLMGFGSWGIERSDDGAFLGQVGLNQPVTYPELELGWVLLEPYEGKGYAFEAAIAARDYAFETLKRETVVSYIDRKNLRSIALARRMGAVQDLAAQLPDDESPDMTAVYRHKAVA